MLHPRLGGFWGQEQRDNGMSKYLCDDGNAEIEIEANSAEAAAQEYVDGGNWGDISETIWVKVYVTPIDEDGEAIEDGSETVTIAVDPEEPECEDGEEHDWRSPYSVLGGTKENPSVWGHGGGVIIKSVCAHCGKYRINDTWAQNPENGVQGLNSVTYEGADFSSIEWLAQMHAKAEAAQSSEEVEASVQAFLDWCGGKGQGR
jgi:hypothetical protein